MRIPSMNIGDSAILPPEMFPSHDSINILFASTKTLAKYLPPSTRPFSSESSRIVSNIVTISHVFDHQVKKVHLLRDKMTVVFSHPSPLDGLVDPRCVWWNGESRNGGDWSSSGCTLLSHDEKSSKCQCDHLTHFALLMDVAGMELSPLDYSLLTLATRIGCGISIGCLLLSFLCFLLFSRHGGDRVFIHKNLCLTLALAQTLFVFTISWTEDETRCRVISSLLLYSFLSALLWMFVEGVQLYFLLVDVFASHSRRLKFSLFCFGLPLIIVAVANYADGENMISKDHCWLAAGSWVMMVAFILPSMLIMVSNVFFLSLAIWIALRRSSNGYMPCKHPSDTKPCAWIKGSIALMSLLGITWSLGFYFIFDSASIYVAYAFTVLNTLQGLFIFLLHVLFNQKMRSDICDWLTRRGCLCTSSTASGDSSTRRTANAFSPSNDSTALFIGGECSDSWLPPRGGGGMYGGGPSYPTHEEMMRHHLYHQQQHGGEYTGGNSTYDYATIAYGEMVAGRGAYGSRPSSHMAYAPPPYLRYGMIPPIDTLPSTVYGGNGPVTRLHHPRLPPPQGMPPLPPSCSPPSLQSSRVSPPSSALRGVSSLPFRRPPSSDDSAYSDSSSMLQSEVTVDGATVLRMNLGRNTSLIQQDL